MKPTKTIRIFCTVILLSMIISIFTMSINADSVYFESPYSEELLEKEGVHTLLGEYRQGIDAYLSRGATMEEFRKEHKNSKPDFTISLTDKGAIGGDATGFWRYYNMGQSAIAQLSIETVVREVWILASAEPTIYYYTDDGGFFLFWGLYEVDGQEIIPVSLYIIPEEDYIEIAKARYEENERRNNSGEYTYGGYPSIEYVCADAEKYLIDPNNLQVGEIKPLPELTWLVPVVAAVLVVATVSVVTAVVIRKRKKKEDTK